MQGKQAINVFNDGMSQDVDILNQQATSYRDSINGRTIFNKDGTYSWETENGTKTSFRILANNGLDNGIYIIIGNCGNNNIRFIYSVREDELQSEIGILSIDKAGIGSYKTLFNDINDPNGDKLNFKLHNQIEARFVYENPKLIRCYWVDGIKIDSNRPRTITCSFDESLATPIGNQSDVNAYALYNTSVFGMSSQTGFKMGLIKYVQNIGGDLLTGVYQYTYSLGTPEGYWTPWYPPTRRIFVCEDAVSNYNWNEYEMGSSGLTSSKGNRIEIKGIDQRYSKIRVAYILAYTPSTVVHSKIFEQRKIDNEIMYFDHQANVGEPLLTTEVADIFSGITGAKTLNIKDSILYYGNIKENVLKEYKAEPILTNLSVTPKIRDMRSDEWAYTNYAKGHLPLTHQWPRTGVTKMRQHSAVGGVEDYQIVGDYINYKGTQVDHLYPGYFRGETYRFAIVFYDLLGFETFALHLCDIKFPEQSTKEYNWTRIKTDGTTTTTFTGIMPSNQNAWPTNNYNDPFLRSDKILDGDTGQTYSGSTNHSLTNDAHRTCSHLRIMGLEFSGIDISSVKDFISGFKIVRTKRDATILIQGLVLPTVGSTVDGDDGGPIISPLPSIHQNFWDFNLQTAPSPSSVASDIKLSAPFQFNGDGDSDNDRWSLRPNISSMNCPALDFGSTQFPNIQSSDRLTLVGGCWDEYPLENSPETGQAYKAAGEYMWYGKAYYTKNAWHYGAPNNEAQYSNTPFPRYMSYAEGIEKYNILGVAEDIANWDGGNRLRNRVDSKDNNDFHRQAHGKSNTVYIKHGNFIPPASGGGYAFSPLYKNIESPRVRDDGHVQNGQCLFKGGFIANYVRPNIAPYGGLTLSSLETSIFFGTGHFQPIGNDTFDNQGMPTDDVFNNIEVFGGDCFLDYHSFLRLLPHHRVGEETDDDLADGRIFPFEYEYNHVMREASGAGGYGPSLIWANVGARPWQSIDGVGFSWLDNGLYSGGANNAPVGLYEEFNLNPVLSYEELTFFYNTKPIDWIDNDIFPVRWRYTIDKIYGDSIDSWRTLQVNDFKDLNGEHGEITSSLYIFNQIYSWQTSAFGRLRALDRALIESQQGGTLSTGVGDKLDGIDYISTEVGNQHQWGLFKSNRAAYWIDVNKRKIFRFAQDGQTPLSDLKGLHQFLELELPLYEDYDNPVLNRGIHGTFDYDNNEAIFTFKRDRRLVAPDSNTDIIIRSRSGFGKTYMDGIVEQNQTAQVYYPYSNNGPNGIAIPNGNNINGDINENTIFYIYTDTYPVAVYTYDNILTKTLLFNADGDSFYRIFRDSINDDWQYVEVNDNDVTPHRGSVTFNEYGNWFESFHSYNPSHYISTKFLVLSQDPYFTYTNVNKNDIQIHDMGLKADFWAFSKKSYISMSINEVPMISKSFDSFRINCNEDYAKFLDTVLMETETMFNLMNMQTDTRKKYLEDILRFPSRGETQKNRMSGKHMLVTFEMKNNFYYNDRITNLVTYYRKSDRI